MDMHHKQPTADSMHIDDTYGKALSQRQDTEQQCVCFDATLQAPTALSTLARRKPGR